MTKNNFIPIDFNTILQNHFKHILVDDDHREIKGADYSINYYFTDNEPASNMLFNLYGENALFELITFSKKHGLQIFDTGNGEMINLDHPEKNGYEHFTKYLHQVLDKSNNKN